MELQTNLVSSASTHKKEEGKNEALEHFKHVIRICQSRGHIFRNKLGNTWTVILKLRAALRIEP